jgi:hypothetical protein
MQVCSVVAGNTAPSASGMPLRPSLGLAKPGPWDEILATALKRQHEPQRFAGDLLKAEISEKQAPRSNTN